MTLPSFIMIDDFLGNPHDLRRRALALRYDEAAKDGNYPGITSDRPIPIAGLDSFVSRAIGREVKPAPDTLHGHCRLTLGSDRGLSGVHIDPAFYSGILYLSLAEHAQGGTDFYRHKRTRLERVPTDAGRIVAAGYGDLDRLVADVVNKDTLKPSAWERTFTAPMRFNRLILFSPWMFHNGRGGFGSTPETARLVYLMFFAAA
jgi:hypothetical protein